MNLLTKQKLMNVKINNIAELKAEIARLSQLKAEQEAYLSSQYMLLRKKIEAPARILGMLTSSIPGVDMVKGLFSSVLSKNKAAGKSDWLTNVLRVGLPLVLNKTLLRNVGWLKKSLVLLVSERAAGQVNQEKIGSILSKLTDLIRPKKKKKKHNDLQPLDDAHQDTLDFGIPPDSETY